MNLHRFDTLIKETVAEVWPGLDWRLIWAQAMAESGMDPNIPSKCGALGLMQLMPATDLEVDGDLDGFDPKGNLDNGIRYLKRQYQAKKLREAVPEWGERYKLALAAYNGGLGYVLKAIALKKKASPTSKDTWEIIKLYLAVEGCVVRGKRPDYKQMWGYVANVERFYSEACAA